MTYPRLTFCVDATLDGVRIDTFLAKHLAHYSQFRVARMVQAGMAQIQHGVVPIKRRVFTGEEVSIELIEPPDMLNDVVTSSDSPVMMPEIVFEDPWIMVVNKPVGIVAHPVGEFQTGTLAQILQSHLDAQTSFPGLLRAGIVHRLDRQTSGLMVVAKEHTSHRVLSEAFAEGRVQKAYAAIVEGVIAEDSGIIDMPIGRSPQRGTVLMSTQPDARDRKPAKTRWRVLERGAQHTLVLARPLTGRNHQIRIHFASLGYPLLREPFYDARGKLKPRVTPDSQVKNADDMDTDRHALHAVSLAFGHPITGVWMTFRSPLAADLLVEWTRLRSVSKSGESI